MLCKRNELYCFCFVVDIYYYIYTNRDVKTSYCIYNKYIYISIIPVKKRAKKNSKKKPKLERCKISTKNT